MTRLGGAEGMGGQTTIGSRRINDMDDGNTTANVLYIGKEDVDGKYVIIKFDQTTATLPTMRYATINNNSGESTYSSAWTNRASLTYGYYSAVF